MTAFLKTLLFLNVQGSVLIILLLALKRLIHKSFSGFWQRNLWVVALLFMLLPVWKLVPAQSVEPVIIPLYNVFTSEYEELFQNRGSNEAIENTELVKETALASKNEVGFSKIIFSLWAFGVLTFLVLSFGSYFKYLVKMKKKSSEILENEVFAAVKEELEIRRKIRVRKVNISQPPLLTGCFFPVIYVPEGEQSEEEAEMVFLHELTHYKHKDLPLKWFVCIINAINWFNPFMYLLVKNINEACEIYCDEAVTKNMGDDGKRAYMNTILNLVEKKGENNV